MYRELAYVISFAPYYWRVMQCARRWFDEADANQLTNLGKYVSAMVAAGARLTYARQPNTTWMIIVLLMSLVATNKSIYYISIALNIVLRVVWLETVMKFNLGIIESRLLDFFLASLEVIRQGHWNFYRLENEHLNNSGNYRAVKVVPLPFRECDSDG
ncbi:hypothetical protein POM88_015309 [Heracleum sosnowskyi]|uniref:EXS domain-containing protein n=1 Tax=Heracleum sosnowskyi TaxID=360622 RepID=A0AAD8ILL0_9APIA|nr:hypothetical protein POM88_015309 [Heracleum sosnowskyi]